MNSNHVNMNIWHITCNHTSTCVNMKFVHIEHVNMYKEHFKQWVGWWRLADLTVDVGHNKIEGEGGIK